MYYTSDDLTCLLIKRISFSHRHRPRYQQLESKCSETHSIASGNKLTDENAALYKCNLCPRDFNTNHGRNIHLSSCRKKFSQEDLTTRLQNSQQEQVQANVNNTAGSQITSSSIEPKLWGDHTKDDIHHKIDVIYEKIAFWRRNLFKLPSGAAGKKFISETTKWIEFWNQDVNEYKDIALKVLMVMPALLLQKPSFKSTAKQHSQCLSRRLTQW